MNSLLAIVAPIAMLLPASAAEQPRAALVSEAATATPAHEPAQPPRDTVASAPFRILEDARRAPVQAQVTIEQRVVIRIAPSSPATRERMMALVPRRASDTTFEEQRLRGCVEIDSIAGVQPAQENRLLLFMRDRRVLTAALDRSCKAEDFYSGFYIERQEDGQLCSRRDRLQSRAGASCRVSQLNRLVAVNE